VRHSLKKVGLVPSFQFQIKLVMRVEKTLFNRRSGRKILM
jgi:hypothetical protein